jgi:hypothetical protein
LGKIEVKEVFNGVDYAIFGKENVDFSDGSAPQPQTFGLRGVDFTLAERSLTLVGQAILQRRLAPPF